MGTHLHKSLINDQVNVRIVGYIPVNLLKDGLGSLQCLDLHLLIYVVQGVVRRLVLQCRGRESDGAICQPSYY